jgi:hypothetical protein
MSLTIKVTNAGRIALVNAANTGTAPVTIAQVGVSATALVPTAAATARPGETKRIAALSGDIVADDTIHLIVRDESADVFTVRSFALYLADGTLFAIFGQAPVLLEKSAQAMMLLALDIRFEDIAASALTFGDTNFLNPPATTTTQGVVELATAAETEAGADAVRAVTPAAAKSAVTTWLDARFGLGAPSAFVKGLLTSATAAAFRLAIGLKAAALKDEGAGNGLDADMVDGIHGPELLKRSGGDLYGALRVGPVTASVTLCPGSLTRSGYMEFWQGAGRLGYIGYAEDGSLINLNVERAVGWNITGSLMRNWQVVWDAGNDGSGSGLDADLLDGAQLSSILAERPSIASNQMDSALANGFHPVLFPGYRNIVLSLSPSTMTSVGTVQLQFGAGGVMMLRNRTDDVAWQPWQTCWNSANDGAGSGLDADLLDGQQGSYYADVTTRLGFTPVRQGGGAGQLGNNIYIGWSGARAKLQVDALDLGNIVFDAQISDVWRAANDGSGSGLDADLLDGQQGSYYADVPARLGFTPLNAAAYTAADVRSKLLTVDGSGSGVDADLLDGYHAADLLPTASLAANGWCRLPNGLILQWGQIAAGANGYTALAFNVPFPTACFHVSVNAATEVGNTAAADNGPLPVPGTATTAGVNLWNASNAATAWWFAIGI